MTSSATPRHLPPSAANTASALTLPSTSLPDDAVQVGRIGDAWGVQGWFKVVPFSSDPQALMGAKTWLLQPPEQGNKHFNGTLSLAVRRIRWHGDSLVANSADVTDRDAAQALRGARVFIARQDFPPAQDGEYYWVDLIGLTVRNHQNVVLGQVKELLSSAAQTVLVVHEDAGGNAKPIERLIPFVDAYIHSVDLPSQTIVADWQPDY
ncbi:MAG: ribosome maturation factor RimM [Comamonas sp.]|nr:ribosome maturation factor RimM [Comamonas sp.]